MNIQTKVTLNDGQQMPAFGFGVSQIPNGKPARNAVTWALEAGYRHIDTAYLYRNEESVGRAVKESKVSREDVWVTTKMYPNQFLNPRKALIQSLKKLKMEYVDLYLIHWPPLIEVPAFDKRLWRAMEALKEEGLCKSIGVSNYPPERLDHLLGYAKTPPSVNQVWLSPTHFDAELYDFCNKAGIKLVGYRPLGRGKELANPIAIELASKYGKTTAQILLRWAIQKGIIPIPRSSNHERIIENSLVFDFELSQKDINQLDGIA